MLMRAFLGRRWGISWGVLKACWAVWRPSWASGGHRDRLGTIFRRLEALLDRLGDVSEPCWCASGTLWGLRPGINRGSPGVLFVRGPPGAAPRARSRKTVNQLPEILERLWPVGPANFQPFRFQIAQDVGHPARILTGCFALQDGRKDAREEGDVERSSAIVPRTIPTMCEHRPRPIRFDCQRVWERPAVAMGVVAPQRAG